jgi:hypothetical protein
MQMIQTNQIKDMTHFRENEVLVNASDHLGLCFYKHHTIFKFLQVSMWSLKKRA